MYLIASDSYALSSQIVTTAEKLAKAKEWARLLFTVIPENKLQECFDLAREAHNSPFPISGYELEIAYRSLREKNGGYVTAADLDRMEQEYWAKREKNAEQ